MMQLAGAILGAGTFAYLLLLMIATARQSAAAQRRFQLECDLLRQQIDVTSALRITRERESLCWNGVRKFVVDRKVPESDGACSFYLVPHDGKQLAPFQPGQFLTFRLNLPDRDKPAVRCYSLSSQPDSSYYRVTIKRVVNGIVSNYFHETIREGTILDAQAPRGQFCIESNTAKPIVMIAGGVGVTPFMSMLGGIAASKTDREAWLFYGVRNSQEHPFEDDLRQFHHSEARIRVATFYSQPLADDVAGTNYDHTGHITCESLRRLLPSNNYDFYLCGPPAMMDSLIGELKEWGVPEENIHSEAFGPKTVRVISKAQSTDKEITDAVQTAHDIRIKFSKSNQEAAWDASQQDLLSFAESQGISIDAGCCAGSCGTCQTAVRAGSVRYAEQPEFPCDAGNCLPCVAIPAEDLVLDA